MPRGRQFWVTLHRWAGLTLALFLAVAGMTGALIAFMDELDPLFAPHLHFVEPPAAGARLLDPLILRDKILESHPGAVINYLPLDPAPGRSLKLRVRRIDVATGALVPWSQDADELFVDPYTGATLGQRRWGDITQGAINLMPFIYRLHYSLALGRVGIVVFGIAALLWTIDSFIGLYLTFPPRSRCNRVQPAAEIRNWWSRWKPNWLLRWSSGHPKLTFDLHRAGGLWLWPLLLVFAWSAVAFNLPEVYGLAMRRLGYEPIRYALVAPAAARHQPALDFKKAATLGRAIADAQSSRQNAGRDPRLGSALIHRPELGIYVYQFTSERDFTLLGGKSMVVFDSDTGELLKVVLPQAQVAANTFTNWIEALHVGTVWGLPHRIAISLVGMLLTVLSVTGVLIWMKKRSARLRSERHARLVASNSAVS